jgi:hypothetical protein
MKSGEFRLRWDDKQRVHVYLDFPNLDAALTHAAVLYAKDEVSEFTALENWLGENACPPDQLLPIAQMRTRAALRMHDSEKAQETLEAIPGYGAFG